MSRSVHRGPPDLPSELFEGVPERLRGRLSLEPAFAVEASDARVRISSSAVQHMPRSYWEKSSTARCESYSQVYTKMHNHNCNALLAVCAAMCAKSVRMQEKRGALVADSGMTAARLGC